MTTAHDPEPSLTISAVAEDRRVVLPIEEVAELTGISVRRLKRRSLAGEVPAERIGNEWLIPRAWVEWIGSWPKVSADAAS